MRTFWLVVVVLTIAAVAVLARGGADELPIVSGRPGAPFDLRIGQHADLGRDLGVTFVAARANGKCPEHHDECVMVLPPQIELELSDRRPQVTRVRFDVMGRQVPPQASGAWMLRVLSVAPALFSDDDVAQRRLVLILQVDPRNDQP